MAHREMEGTDGY